MAKITLLNNQSSMDAALLTYGRHYSLFRLHEDNEEAIVDLSKKVPEIDFPAVFEVGKEISFDENDLLFDLNVDKIYKKEPVGLATGINENKIAT